VEPALTCAGERHAPQRLQKPYGLLPLAISRQSQALASERFQTSSYPGASSEIGDGDIAWPTIC